MNFCVIGPGAMGCLFAAFLARAGFSTVLVDYKPERAQHIREQGLVIEELDGSRSTVPVQAVWRAEEVGSVDAVLICVKSYDTPKAARTAARIAGDHTLVVTLQNGIGNVEALAGELSRGQVVAGITSHGATVLGPGQVRHAGRGDTFLGLALAKSLDQGLKTRLEELAQVLGKAGFQTEIVDNIQDLLWSKLIINVGINALTAITRLRNGQLVRNREIQAVLEQAVEEALAVGRKEGIHFIYEDPVAQVKKVCELTAANISSMLQDVMNRKTTEIDFINGAVVQKGETLGIPTPVNQTLTRVVRGIQATYHLQV